MIGSSPNSGPAVAWPPPSSPATAPPFAVSGSGRASLPLPGPVQPRPPEPPPPGSGHVDRRRRRFRRALAAAGALAVIALSLSIDAEPIAVVIALFVLVVPFEKLFPRHRQRLRRPQVGTDVGYALAGPVLTAVGLVAAVFVAGVSLAWLPGLALRPLVSQIPSALLPFVGIALFDLAIYWTHRWYHEVPFLWRFHAIHHSTEHLDWVSGFRNHPLDGTLIAPAFAFLLAAGFSAEFTGVLAVVQLVIGIFLHANVRWRWRWLHRIVITPEFHHWHHANEPGAINSNYSVFLPAWDLLFGTYFMPKDRRPSRYGVSEPIPVGMLGQLWHPLRGIGNPLRVVRHPVRSVRALFRFLRSLLRDMRRSATRPRNRPSTVPAHRPAPPDPASPTIGAWPPPAPDPAPGSELVPTAVMVAPVGPNGTRSMDALILAPTRMIGLADVMGWEDGPARSFPDRPGSDERPNDPVDRSG